MDKEEREHLEQVVADMRERVEGDVESQLSRRGLDDRPAATDAVDDDTLQLVEAIDSEGVDGQAWDEAFDQYVTEVGYTIVNRLAALRCMEVRGFVDEAVTVFEDDGLTPAAETLVREEFLLEDEAILSAYRDACDELAREVEVLFDRSSAHSLIDPDDDTFEELCGMLDEIPDGVWRADDVLGWVYEYYNRPAVEALDAKNALEPDDVAPANRFYTPHWVVRMLADNSLGKLYLESTDRESIVPDPGELTIEERKERLVTPEDSPNVSELCTYLIADRDDSDDSDDSDSSDSSDSSDDSNDPDDQNSRNAPSFDDPSEIRVIDPACGSGHFLLYAFDVLERIWWAERPDLERSEIPAKILEHNLYGVDIDLRSCQLCAFNLYLKARARAADESDDDDDFEMPNVGIVCADARVAEVEEALEVLDRVAVEGTGVREALDESIEEFRTTEALGGLLDVRGALSGEFAEDQTGVILKQLREAVEERTSGGFGERNLRSFLDLVVVLAQDYDVALMNPPYGSRGRMPKAVKDYVKERYDYAPEYYVNFFEACDRLVKPNGRIGMLVPWSFMFNRSFEDFREDFVGSRGSFDFLAEFGYDILDNATVGTVGTVVRSGTTGETTGTFIRLHDVEKANKERTFLGAAFDSMDDDSDDDDNGDNDGDDGVRRRYEKELSEFAAIPGTPISYWVPAELRSLYESECILDTKRSEAEQRGLGDIRQGLATGDDDRFLRSFWETDGDSWVPFAKGGADAWLLPRIKSCIRWGEYGAGVRRYDGGNGTPSEQLYFEEGLTYTVAKRSGRRFGYLPEGSIFGHKGSVFVPDRAIWSALSYTNSRLFTYLMLAQTSERMWEVGFVSKVPWREELAEIDELEALAREAVGHLVSKRQYEFVSPYYDGPVLLDVLGIDDSLPQYDHPHRELRGDLDLGAPEETVPPDASLRDVGVAAAKHLERVEANLQSCADAIDEAVFDCFDITDDQRETVLQEIALRTIEDPREREEHDPDAITEPSEDFPEMVKDLLLHLTIRILHEDDDGVVPISDVDGEADLLVRIEGEFERLFGERASARLAEVDRVLGGRTADEEAYPNLREWLENDCFDYHVSTFDRTPILWRLTTERLVSDPEGEGFACLVDYHQLDANVFDRLRDRYLESRKALLRERRNAADRRRGDDSLSASERAEAAAEHARCESGLEQVDVFEDGLAELARSSPREWPEENQRIARDAAQKVADFRAETASRLETLEALAELDDVDVEELFNPSFYETIRENRDEWLDALGELEAAFEAYAAGGSEPVEAHRYDLFEYYDDLVGSAHYASNGILFTTYYFDKFEEVDRARRADGGVSDRRRLLSELASGLEAYEALANEIREVCDTIASDISADWTDRALSEITTAGYRPNRKHGVAINITPLAGAEIVPRTVDDEVL